jgi:hypothetical protein
VGYPLTEFNCTLRAIDFYLLAFGNYQPAQLRAISEDVFSVSIALKFQIPIALAQLPELLIGHLNHRAKINGDLAHRDFLKDLV